MSIRDDATEFLRELGADAIDHPGGTLLAHLNRVGDTLGEWGASPAVQLAGLCHAMYGTDGFDHALLAVTERDRLRQLVGDDVEALVYLYGSCDRSATYPQLDQPQPRFRDRFTGNVTEPADTAVDAFMAITVANELDVMTHNAELRAEHGAALEAFFERCRHRLSPKAYSAIGGSFTT